MHGTASSVVAVAVLDDGELEDVRQILDELGVEFAHWTKMSVPAARRDPERLLVATATLAVSLGYQRVGQQDPRPVWIAVSATDSRTQRSRLLQSGFDYLIRRPVHSSALRLLLQRALYRGDEQRRGARVAVGYGVRYRAGLWSRPATLVDLSPGGFRLLTRHTIDVGAKLRLKLPGSREGGRAFDTTAVALRARRGDLEGGEADELSVAGRFIGMTGATKGRIRSLLATLTSGPASLPEAEREDPAEPTRRPAGEIKPRSPRSTYEGRVLAFGDAECVLIGRDLSLGGMRVDPHPALAVGDSVRLAIPSGSREEPIVVAAQVARDDGRAGLGLKFESIEDGGADRIEALVASLPAIESLAAPPQAGPGVVLSQLLPKLMRIPRGSGD